LTTVALLSVGSCAAPKSPAQIQSNAAGNVRPFDLLARGFDDNGLGLNSELGWHYNRRCKLGGVAGQESDPASCSWRFIADGTQPTTSRPPCNSGVMDPDLSTFVLSKIGITCSDSPIGFPGHINWGSSYGGASVYEGWLTWDGFSGPLPRGDFDLNFVLTLPDEHAPAMAEGINWDWLGVEFDSREVTGFGSPWWRELEKKIRSAPVEVNDYVGRKFAIVTGLMGIDAEHLSARNPSMELHPAYSIALRVEPDDSASGPTERWAMFARDRGNEGLCSNWDRVHVLPLLNGSHVIRLPWRKGMTDLKIGGDTQFCSSGEGSPSVTISFDDDHEGVLVRIHLPPGNIVDGDLQLQWTGTAPASEKTKEAPKPTRKREHAGEMENPDVLQQKLQRLQSDTVEWAAYNGVSLEPTCRPVPVRLERAAVLPRGTQRSACGSPSATVAKERALAIDLADQPRDARAESPSFVSFAPTKKVTETPRQKYCSTRANKSAAAQRFCSEKDED
jgi:hypothetical protein